MSFELDGNIIASGHRAADLLAMVESGALTMCYFSASYLAARVPEFALLDLPPTINDRERAAAILTDSERAEFVAAVAPVREQQQRAFGNQLFNYLEA